MDLKIGDRFSHKRILDPSRLPEQIPLICVVTAIRYGCIFWKEDGACGASAFFPVSESGRWVKEILKSPPAAADTDPSEEP